MHRIAITIIAAVALTSCSAFAHDASKHKGKSVQGEVVSSAGDGFQLKTETGVIPVTFSSKTKFEHGNAAVDKTHVKTGERLTVFGTKLPSGVLVAREVLIGRQVAGKETAAPKAVKRNSSEAHKR